MDWNEIVEGIQVNRSILFLFQWIDDICRVFLAYPGLVGWLDAHMERVAVYTLTSYIEAHVYARSRIPFFLGSFSAEEDEMKSAYKMEEENLIYESTVLIDKAKLLLEQINVSDVTKLYTHRAANLLIHKQVEMVDEMIRSGELCTDDAHKLFNILGMDESRLQTERNWHKEDMVTSMMARRIAKEREIYKETSRMSFTDRLSVIRGNHLETRDSMIDFDRGSISSSMRLSVHDLNWNGIAIANGQGQGQGQGHSNSGKNTTWTGENGIGGNSINSTKKRTGSDMWNTTSQPVKAPPRRNGSFTNQSLSSSSSSSSTASSSSSSSSVASSTQTTAAAASSSSSSTTVTSPKRLSETRFSTNHASRTSIDATDSTSISITNNPMMESRENKEL